MDTRKLLKLSGRTVLMIVLLSIVLYSSFTAIQSLNYMSDDDRPRVEINPDGVTSPSESSNVIKYEQLSDQQQNKFRDIIAGDDPEYMSTTTKDITNYDYIYLDGKYYGVSQSNLPSVNGLTLTFGIVGSVLVSIGILVLLFLVLRLTILLVSLIVSLISESLEQYSELVGFMQSYTILFVVGMLLVIGLLSSPFIFGFEAVSAEKHETPVEGDITLAENLSDQELETFYKIASEPKMTDESETFANEYDVIKSDGEYYTLHQHYPLTPKVVVVGAFYWSILMGVYGAITALLSQVETVLYRADNNSL